VVGFTDRGRNGLRDRLHQHVREAVLPGRSSWGPRKVHLNSWEALGFAVDSKAIAHLADQAKSLGVERLVLDDGWFSGRRDDRAGLGDWVADEARFRGGLGETIAHVEACGLEFGLWIEPEVVSPDSDLFRAHPDWCLAPAGRAAPTQRNQLVLDLSRGEVVDALFERIDALLRNHPIAYLKWDHNRPLFPNPIGHTHTIGFLALLDRVRAAHPAVEIESCASGGGRIDLAVLRRCHRVWPSDNNDPIDRLRINRAWSLFLPLEVLGTHVGPSPNPITGRRASIDLRAKVALFGHMGVEANPADMTSEDRARLAEIIALHKEWRAVLHGGTVHEIRLEDCEAGMLAIAQRGGAGMC
jgi:alpha-galactosidase